MIDNKQTFPGSIAYISHGGGPLPLLGDPAHDQLVVNLRQLAAILPRPSAVVIVSAHWEADKATVTGGGRSELIYDYYGFPRESYSIAYPAPGEPALAARIFDLLTDKGLEPVLDKKRGFDHGVFVPLKIMYPEADIPCVQLSLLTGLQPLEHILIGEALAALRSERVLLLGSGFSFHNLQAFFAPTTEQSQSMNSSFERWLIDTCTAKDLQEQERRQRLVDWQLAPGARYCHPREEHLLPLHVCYGAAQAPAAQVFNFEVMGKKASAYLW